MKSELIIKSSSLIYESILFVSYESVTAQQPSKECVRKVNTYSALCYSRQLPHVVRCWLEPVAICTDKVSIMLRVLRSMGSFFNGHQL